MAFLFQKRIQYDILGLSNAPDYFRIEKLTGEVKIKADLRDDPVRQTLYRVT